MLAVAPAQAGSGLIKVTHANPPYSGGHQNAPAVCTCAQPAVNQPKAAEVQVAVMAIAPAQPAAKRSVYIHR
jgi:hypothetical protein